MYYKKFYALDGKTPVPAVIRSYTEADFTELITIQSEAFPPPYPAELWWNREQLQNHVTLFPEGALCVEVAGELAGSVTGFLMNFDPEAPAHHHTWSEVTADGYLTTHQPGGTRCISRICVSVPGTASWVWARSWSSRYTMWSWNRSWSGCWERAGCRAITGWPGR